MSSVTIKNTFIDVENVDNNSAIATSLKKSSSLPAGMSSLNTLEESDESYQPRSAEVATVLAAILEPLATTEPAGKRESEEGLQRQDSDATTDAGANEGSDKGHQPQDSEVATDSGVEDVNTSDSSHFGAESEADGSSSAAASQAAASSKASGTPLSTKARPWQPSETDPLQCMPTQQFVPHPFHQDCFMPVLPYDTLPYEFAQDAANIVMGMNKALEKKAAVSRVDTLTAADGGWDVFVNVADLAAGQRLLDHTMDCVIKRAEESLCSYVLGCEGKPFFISAEGLCFTAYFAAMRDEETACRSMYDHGFCHGHCGRAHPPCVLRLSVTVVLNNGATCRQ